jgi:hypothetical protein
MKKQTYTVTDDQIAALEGLYKKPGMKKSEHVRRAIDIYIAASKRSRQRSIHR